MKRLALMIVAVSFWSANVFAQETAAKQAFQQIKGFSESDFVRIVSIERTPRKQRYVVEVETKQSARIPIVLERSEETFTVVWVPKGEFTVALKNLTASNTISDGQGAKHRARIPAMPIVVTNKRFVTPFGVVAPVETDSIALNEELAKHTSKWIREVYANDPAPAEFDIIASKDTTWARLSEVIFGVSSQGLYLVNLVTKNGVVRIAAPVSTLISKEKPAAATFALYRLQSGFGVRIIVGNRPVVVEKPCAPQMTFCAANLEGIATTAASFVTGLKTTDFVLLAATKKSTADDVAKLAEPLAKALGIAPYHTIAVYIEGAP